MLTPIVDTTEETPGTPLILSSFLFHLSNFSEEQLRVREEGHARVLHVAGLLPFANMSKYDPEQLLSVANFLRTEIITLQHTILHAHSQYKSSLAQLEEINNHRLGKLGIDDSMDTESIVEDLTNKGKAKESVASTSKGGYVSA